MKAKLPLLITAVLIVLLFFLFPWLSAPQRLYAPKEKNNEGKVIRLGNLNITVEVADTDDERVRGLSGRTSLLRDHGMLFVFSQKSQHEFWMKDMKFPLDFIWIADNRVVDLARDVPYPKNGESPATIIPKAPIDKVLEVNAGVIDSSQVKIGDHLADF